MPPIDWLYIQDLQLWDNFINEQNSIKMLHILTQYDYVQNDFLDVFGKEATFIFCIIKQ